MKIVERTFIKTSRTFRESSLYFDSFRGGHSLKLGQFFKKIETGGGMISFQNWWTRYYVVLHNNSCHSDVWYYIIFVLKFFGNFQKKIGSGWPQQFYLEFQRFPEWICFDFHGFQGPHWTDLFRSLVSWIAPKLLRLDKSWPFLRPFTDPSRSIFEENK